MIVVFNFFLGFVVMVENSIYIFLVVGVKILEVMLKVFLMFKVVILNGNIWLFWILERFFDMDVEKVVG